MLNSVFLSSAFSPRLPTGKNPKATTIPSNSDRLILRVEIGSHYARNELPILKRGSWSIDAFDVRPRFRAGIDERRTGVHL